MPDLQALLAQSAALHNHLCPRQVLGVQMGIYAGELLSLDLPQADKRLYALIETDGCFADGVAVASGCRLGRRTMRLLDYGKVAVTFYDTLTGRAVRLAPRPEVRSRAVALFPQAQSRWHAQLQAYQQLSRPELFTAQFVSLTLDMRALISRPDVRVTCARCGEEILNEREVLVNGEALCRSCAGECYYTVICCANAYTD
ncbi:MAG: FmdE family protein [Anaerolineae bacterium]|nr:FmdE family protein [Anaerolineae bacterium]MDW8300243.1 FmdE family protein [Anaerolineae bacterium]